MNPGSTVQNAPPIRGESNRSSGGISGPNATNTIGRLAGYVRKIRIDG
jgi:hypothetical protein